MNTGIWACSILFLKTLTNRAAVLDQVLEKSCDAPFLLYVISSRQLGHDHTCGEGLILLLCRERFIAVLFT